MVMVEGLTRNSNREVRRERGREGIMLTAEATARQQGRDETSDLECRKDEDKSCSVFFLR